ncbi:hypothetical protein CPB86DRAFT_183424 [Serendipita vermifera]|nr:hypothetical protein CPB86DRAFT_183424 [Serendipita vermifera]
MAGFKAPTTWTLPPCPKRDWHPPTFRVFAIQFCARQILRTLSWYLDRSIKIRLTRAIHAGPTASRRVENMPKTRWSIGFCAGSYLIWAHGIQTPE